MQNLKGFDMFERVLGQKKALAKIESDLQAERLAESYLFAGPEGVGKRFTALEAAKVLSCSGTRRSFLIPEQDTSPVPCGQCGACRRVDENIHPDVFVLDFQSQAGLLEMKEEEAAKQKEFRIDAVRILLGRAQVSPLESGKKVFVIDGAEFLSEESANSLLKVLEESPKHAVWFLIAKSPERVIPTIRSRCRKVWFSPLAPEAIQAILSRESRDAQTGAEISRVAGICNGSLSEARAILEAGASNFAGAAESFLDKGKAQDALRVSQEILSENKKLGSKKSAEQFLKFLSFKIARDLREAPTESRAESLLAALAAQQHLQRNVSPQMVLDSLLLSLKNEP